MPENHGVIPEPIVNGGVIPDPMLPDTGQAGEVMPYEILVPDGNWQSWMPQGEPQSFPKFDTMACITFSMTNVLETLYYFHTGVRKKFSRRFLARMSGTTPEGNWRWKVSETLENGGIVEDSEWPVPPNPTWATYYTAPPVSLVIKAKDFIKDWEVTHEAIDTSKESLLFHIKQSPLTCIFPNHSVMDFFSTQDINSYLDSYSPYIKSRVGGFTSATKYRLRKRMIITNEQLDKIYRLGFKRPVDAGGVAQWGFTPGVNGAPDKPAKELDVVLDGLLASKENAEFTPIFQAVKNLENDVRNGMF